MESPMNDLIARLEAATEGSRELDAEIAALMGTAKPAEHVMLDPKHWEEHPERYPPYTTSLDAALGLVPEEVFLYRLDGWHDEQCAPWGWGVKLMGRTRELREAGLILGQSRSTPALALCAAALRARL